MPKTTPRADSAFTDWFAQENADLHGLAQRQTEYIFDWSRPTHSPPVWRQTGIGSTVPFPGVYDYQFTVPLTWDTPPISGNLLVAVPVTPNANLSLGGYGSAQGWTDHIAYDYGYTTILTRIADGGAYDSSIAFLAPMVTSNPWVEVCMVSCWEIKARTYDPVTPIGGWWSGFDDSNASGNFNGPVTLSASQGQIVFWGFNMAETYYTSTIVTDDSALGYPWITDHHVYYPEYTGGSHFSAYNLWDGRTPAYGVGDTMTGQWTVSPGSDGQKAPFYVILNGA